MESPAHPRTYVRSLVRRSLSFRASLAVVFALAAALAIAAAAFTTRSLSVTPSKATHDQRAAMGVPRPAPKKVAAKPAPGPHRLSAFEEEQRMGFSQLMNRWQPVMRDASKRFSVPQPWIRAVMQIESGGRTMLGENTPIRSSMGAQGLMQLMPETYDEMRRTYGLGANPYDPHDNIYAGAAYLHILKAKYGYPQMFAAYNDGPGNLEERMARGGLLPAETQTYMGSIAKTLAGVHGGKGMQVRFTRPNGAPVMIDSAVVISVRAALPGEYAPGVQTVIRVGRLQQGVRESLAAARAAIRAHGGGV